ncbi:MAG: hypothetical protein IPO58_25810 [Betaproteobacteria bacterium]|nr:hypothetical protein [Betaproteobacteria bacterium]
MRKEHPDRWGDILQAGNSRPPLTLRVNRRKCLRDGEMRAYALAGIACRAIGTDGIVVEDSRNVLALPDGRRQGVGAGLRRVAGGAVLRRRGWDAGAGRAVPRPAARRRTFSRAPGAMIAPDRDNRRLGKIWENLARFGLSAHDADGVDAANLDSWWDALEFGSGVLVDVPCTASGVIRRHPDVKRLRRAGDVAQFRGSSDVFLE